MVILKILKISLSKFLFPDGQITGITNLGKLRTVMKWNSSEQKSRRNEVVLWRLRLGHTKLTHGYLMEGKDPPKCDTCGVTITVHHSLTECRKFLHQRRLHLGSSPKLEVVLGDDEGWVKRLFAILNARSILEKF